MSVRRLGRLGALCVVAIAVVILGVWLDFAKLLEAEPEAVATPRETTEIRTQQLARSIEFAGDMEYASPLVVRNLLGGSVHGIAPSEALVEAGDLLFLSDDQPVILLTGETPAFRTMAVDVVGSDVEQLEASLVSMGYDPSATVTVDDTYTSNTAAMVSRWQQATGQTATGEVELGAVVFGQATMRVGSAGDGDDVVTLTSTHREVTFEAPFEELTDLPATVEVRLPDRSSFETPVSDRRPLGDGQWLVSVAVPDAVDVPALDIVPVTASWQVVETDELLTVPAGAVIRLDSGRYVVEVVEPDGATNFIEIGVTANSGGVVGFAADDLAAGTTIISP